MSKPALIVAILFSTLLTACGGGGGGTGSVLPSQDGPAGLGNLGPGAAARPSAAPSATPAANGTSNPSSLPVQTDTSSSTQGVFLGEACPPTAGTSCTNFANEFRHGIAVGTIYAGWNANLTSLMSAAGIDAWPAQHIIPEITWQPPAGVTLTAIASGTYDTEIVAAANELKAFGGTVFLRPMHEFNGAWYPWGLPNQGADSAADANFIAAWQHLVNVFRSAGATNVKFVWCFSAGMTSRTSSEPWDNPAAAYPGDAYVDWISFDAYNRGSLTDGVTWESFDQAISSAYALAASISPNKPISISEMASNEYGDGGAMKAQWITQMLSELSSANDPYPRLHLITWFEPDVKGYLYAAESTNASYDAFVNGLRAVNASNQPVFRSNGAALANVTGP